MQYVVYTEQSVQKICLQWITYYICQNLQCETVHIKRNNISHSALHITDIKIDFYITFSNY